MLRSVMTLRAVRLKPNPFCPARRRFAIIFTVPQAAELKELLFTLAANGQREQSKDAGISLTGSSVAVK